MFLFPELNLELNKYKLHPLSAWSQRNKLSMLSLLHLHQYQRPFDFRVFSCIHSFFKKNIMFPLLGEVHTLSHLIYLLSLLMIPAASISLTLHLPSSGLSDWSFYNTAMGPIISLLIGRPLAPPHLLNTVQIALPVIQGLAESDFNIPG